jgi:hypothetical protein
MATITVKPGQTVNILGVPADSPLPPIVPGPVDPGYSPPWAQVPPGGQGGGPVDPGYSPPWARPRPPGGPVDPGYSPPWAQVPGGPVDPGYSPPWAQIPVGPPVEPPTEPPPTQPPPATDAGHWVWAWSPQANRWVWVRVPGEGEAAPKTPA